MADLVSMRAEAAEARAKIDHILGIDGELSTAQVSELEQADADFKRMTEEVRKAEIVDSARQSLATPSYDFRSNAPAAPQKKLNSRQLFAERLLCDIRNGKGSWQTRMFDAAADSDAEFPQTGNASDMMPVDLQNEMVRLLGEIQAVRQAATVRTYATDVEIPVVAARGSITGYTGEGEAYENVDWESSKLGFRSYKSTATTIITEEVLADNRGDAAGETIRQHAELHGEFWESKFLGSAAAQANGNPDGILATNFNAVPGAPSDYFAGGTTGSGSTSFSDVTYTDLVETAFKMPAAYWNRPKSWIVGPGMFRALLALADNQGRPMLLQQATGTAQEARTQFNLLGYPVLVSDEMPTDAAGAFAAVLLARDSYVVADRTGLTTSTDDSGVYGNAGVTAYRSRMRCDGRWVLPTASSRLLLAGS